MKTETFKTVIKTTPTRFSSCGCLLHIGKFKGFWQAVVEQDGEMNQTGPQCKTKYEMFHVIPQVAEQWGII